MFSSLSPDTLAYYTWFHGTAMGFAMVGGLAAFALYLTRKYDGDKIMPGWEWRRGTGHGTYAGKVTLADLYRSNHKGKSYRKSWVRTGRFLCFCGAVFIWFIAFMFPQILSDVMETESNAWAADFALFNAEGRTELSEVFARPAFLPTVLIAVLAVILGFRMGYGILRLFRHKWRKKNGRGLDSMSPAENACMGLSTADCIISLAAMLAFIYPVVRAFLCLFGEGAAEAQKLPDEYYSIFPWWQGGLSAAYLIWAFVQSILRRKISKKHRRR